MIDRRDLLIGGACAGSFGLAEFLRPRATLRLLGDIKIGSIIPRRMANWSAEDGGDIVIPKTPGSLTDRLYSESVARTYSRTDGQDTIMLLIAYGQEQSDSLQLHRPETCYPAIGFSITERHFIEIPLLSAAPVPGIALTAVSGERTEDIVYWTRLGEYLPRTADEQRRDRLATVMQGLIADGVLIRASMLRTDKQPGYDMLINFLSTLVTTMAPSARKALVGSTRGKAMVG